MRLAISCGYAGMGLGTDTLDLVREAERLGYAQAWVAEAYGSDAPTVLAWLAGQTSTIGLGAGVMQIPARTPAMTAMTAATLDTLSGGRFHLGLGVSGPQVSEGWHGVRFAAPLARTREYVEIVRMALRREQVPTTGEHFTLPLPDGPGKALRLTIRPPRDRPADLPRGGRPAEPAAGRRDRGRLARRSSSPPSTRPSSSAACARGASRRGRDPGRLRHRADRAGRGRGRPRGRAARSAGYTALYIGGMGSREQNFYNRLARRMGYEEAAAKIQDLYLERGTRGRGGCRAAELVDSTALSGSRSGSPNGSAATWMPA